MEFDVIVRNGEVIDGSGKPRSKQDVGLKGDSIAAVGNLEGATAPITVDAAGQVVTPGFIDMHSHADQTILVYPYAQSFIGQGITTTVCGQCGFSPAPLNKHYAVTWWEFNWWDMVEKRKYDREVVGDLGKARKAAKEVAGLDMNWSTFGEWLGRLDSDGIGLNIAPLVGHSTIRAAVMGTDYRRHATKDEIDAMKRYVEEAMDSGAQGISDGMDYAPNSYCAPEESVEVIGVAAKKGGLFSTHWRRTGLREGFGNPGLIQGLKEAIEIARKTGAKFEVAHLGSGYQILPSSTPKLTALAAEETLAVIDDAVKSGVDLTFDVIPNSQGGGVGYSKYLASPLSPWLKEAGSMEKFADNLRAPDLRNEIRQFIMSGKWYSLNPIVQPGWANAILISKSKADGIAGKTLAEVAAKRGEHALDTLMDIIMEDPWTTTGLRKGDEATKQMFLKHQRAMVAIDTFVVDETYEGKNPPYPLPSHNTFGGMARYLSLYAVPEVLGLEEGVRRLTGFPAERLGLSDRGTIAVGKKADIVVFKPEAVKDVTTDDEPRRYPEGFSWVFVNGVAAMENGKLKLTRSGRALRRK